MVLFVVLGQEFAPIMVTVPYGTVGLILAYHRPGNPIGWLLLSIATLPGVALALGSIWVSLGSVMGALGVLLVVFPTGRVPGRSWWIALSLLGGGWLLALTPPAVSFGGGNEVPVGSVVAITGLLWCGATPFVRFKRARGLERVQLRWLGFAAGATAAAAVVSMGAVVVGWNVVAEPFGALAALGGFIGIPAAIGIAVTRYHLYDIGRIVSRTVTYSVVVGGLALLFAAGAIWLPE
jgi:hypothetical protein